MSNPPISFIVFSYNQEEFVSDAIESAFAQDYEGLEIILSDDCSPDSTYEVMQSIVHNYDGRHSVKLLEQAENNLGLVDHLNRVFAHATGEWIVLCAGDDAATSERCSKIANAIATNPKLRGIFSGYQDCDQSLARLSEKTPLQTQPISTWQICRSGGYVFPGATFALHRDCIDQFSQLNKNIRAVDWVLPLKAAILGEVGFLQQSLVRKRNLDDSLTMVNKTFDHSKPERILKSHELTANILTIQEARKSNLISGFQSLILPILLRLYARIQYCKLAGRNASFMSLLAGIVSSLLLLRANDFLFLVKARLKRDHK